MGNWNEIGPEQQTPPRDSLRRFFLLFVIGFGVVLLLVMLSIAYGPSAAIFGIVIAAIAFMFMARRYQYSLRTLLLVMTVLSVWLGLKLSRDSKLERAISAIESSGGQLKVYNREPNFPWGLWKYRYNLSYYGLKKQLSEQEFRPLELLSPSSLHRLDLSNTGITDSDLKSIEGHSQLEFLSLANETYASGGVILNRPQNIITDEGLARLAQLRNLRGIDLSGTDITDDGLKFLSEIPHLLWVYLSGTKVTGEGISYLRNHDNLTMVELNGCKLTKAGYQELIQLPNIYSLGLSNSGIMDEDLQLLETNMSLGILRLRKTEVSDEAVQQFQLAHPKCKIER